MQTLTYTIGKDRRALVSDVQDFHIDFKGSETNWVQARQYENAMRQVFVNVKNDDGTPFDLTGSNIWFEGVLPDKTHKILDAKHAVLIDAQAGQFRFDLPAQAFAVSGSYVQAFFRIVRDGNSITTLEFSLEVLADKVISGLVARDYVTPFEDLYDQLETILNNADGKMSGKLTEWDTTFKNKISELEKTGHDTQTWLEVAKDRLQVLEDKIKQDGLFTEAEAEGMKNKFALIYSTATDMRSSADDNLKVGRKCITLGYRTPFDGGGATYQIVNGTDKWHETLANGLAAELAVDADDYVSVTAFGATTDSDDISDIVNEVTGRYKLKFPAGNFRVAKTLRLVNSVSGSGKGRHEGQTNLISRLRSGVLVDVSSLKSNGSVDNIGLTLNGTETGIEYRPTGWKLISLKNLSIQSVSGTGISIVDNVGISRAVYMDNISIYGANTTPESVGIDMQKTYDNRLNNIEIMGTKEGVKLSQSYVYGDNWHVWCGNLGSQNSDWSNQTKCISLDRSTLTCSQVYTDTARVHYYMGSGAFVNLTNILAMDDGGRSAMSRVDLVDGENAYRFRATGGKIYLDDKMGGIDAGSLVNVDRVYEKISIDDYASRNVKDMGTSNSTKVTYNVSVPDGTEDTKFVKIARIAKKKYTTTTFTITDYNTLYADVVVIQGDDTVIKKKIKNPTYVELKYKVTDSSIDLYASAFSKVAYGVRSARSEQSALINGPIPADVVDGTGLSYVLEEGVLNPWGDYLLWNMEVGDTAIITAGTDLAIIWNNADELKLSTISGDWSKASFSRTPDKRKIAVRRQGAVTIRVIK